MCVCACVRVCVCASYSSCKAHARRRVMRRTITRNTQTMYLFIVGSGSFCPYDVYLLTRKCIQRSCMFVCVCARVDASGVCRQPWKPNNNLSNNVSSMLEIAIVSRSAASCLGNDTHTQTHMCASVVSGTCARDIFAATDKGSHANMTAKYSEMPCALQHRNAENVGHVQAQLSVWKLITPPQALSNSTCSAAP